MNVTSIDIADMLETESVLGLTLADNMHIGSLPAKPNECIAIYDTPGMPPGLTLDSEGNDYYYPSIQIQVRSNDYQTGWNLVHDIMVVLHGRAQETWNGTLYTVIYCSSGPALLDWDENGRVRFIVNFNVQRRAA
jgi:hypothetical protein